MKCLCDHEKRHWHMQHGDIHSAVSSNMNSTDFELSFFIPGYSVTQDNYTSINPSHYPHWYNLFCRYMYNLILMHNYFFFIILDFLQNTFNPLRFSVLSFFLNCLTSFKTHLNCVLFKSRALAERCKELNVPIFIDDPKPFTILIAIIHGVCPGGQIIEMHMQWVNIHIWICRDLS